MLRDFMPTSSVCDTATDPSQVAMCRAAGFEPLVFAGSDDNTMQCLDASSVVTQPIDSKAQDIAANWNPPPTFSPDQVRQIVSAVLAYIQQAQNAVDQAMAQPNANQSDLMNAGDDLARHGQQAVDYTTAANQADAKGTGIVNAPHMKQWVLNSMNSASNAMVAAYVVSCTTPWWVDALGEFQSAFDQAWQVISNIVGAVVNVGEAAINAVETAAAGVAWAARALSWISSNLPWLALGLVTIGGVVVYRHYKREVSLFIHHGEDE